MSFYYHGNQFPLGRHNVIVDFGRYIELFILLSHAVGFFNKTVKKTETTRDKKTYVGNDLKVLFKIGRLNTTNIEIQQLDCMKNLTCKVNNQIKSPNHQTKRFRYFTRASP